MMSADDEQGYDGGKRLPSPEPLNLLYIGWAIGEKMPARMMAMMNLRIVDTEEIDTTRTISRIDALFTEERFATSDIQSAGRLNTHCKGLPFGLKNTLLFK